MKAKKIIGIILGDHAGIGPETVAKALLENKGAYIPVLIGNHTLFEKALDFIPEGKRLNIESISSTPTKGFITDENKVYFLDVPAGSDIHYGQISADSGKLAFESITAAIGLERAGIVDGLVMAPITKHALHLAGKEYESEFEIFADLYGVENVKGAIKCEDIYRSTVVGHCAFSQIVNRLNTDNIVSTAKELLKVMRLFRPADECKIAVAALNPHAGEDGLFGDEEARIIAPAVKILREEGEDVIGPCPADTVLLKARHQEVNGIVYLYHDQGNIAMKSSFFGGAVLIYTKIPAHIVSVGHGSALDIAGNGKADAKNMIASIDVMLKILQHKSTPGKEACYANAKS